ncbi:MAG: hypothetical protein H6819_06630 [Phycisphaerales bacterium]|nr:hypothetical protein [Phycisphaerales bacterium]MCB9855256.1 hypothetical protein [Phycisphaerales bacterium]MCB9862849.1 hypothetical protein [Phycisphaerales bacterium]
MAKFGEFKYGEGKYGAIATGYRVYATAGRSPDPDVDAPIVTVEQTETSVDLDVPFPGAAGRMYGLVVPFNAQGQGVPGAGFSFAFDAEGDVDASPAPAVNLKLTPRAGGYAELTWSYRDSELLLKADQFELGGEFAADTGEASTLLPIVVEREPLRSDYRRMIGPLPAGLLTMKVVAATTGGSKESNVQTVTARVDPAAPSDISLVLQAI